MTEQRPPFRFRLPWLAASQSQPAPAAPRPRAPVPAPTPPQLALAATRPRAPVPPSAPAPAAQRPPFRPAGVAQPARSEPPPPSQAPPPSPSPSRATSTSQAPPASPSRARATLTSQARPPSPSPSPSRATAPQKLDTSPHSPARRPSPPPPEAPKAHPPSPPSVSPPSSKPALKSPFPPKQEPTITEVSQPKEPKQPETLPPSPQEPRPIVIPRPAPPPEKVVEPLAEEKRTLDVSKELAAEASGPKPETKQQPIRVEPSELPKGMLPDESRENSAVPDEVIEKKEVQGHEKMTGADYSPAIKKKKEDTQKFVQKSENRHSIITLSGENTGATMHLSSSDSGKPERPIPIHRGYKIKPYDNVAEVNREGHEGSFRGTESEDMNEVRDDKVAATNYIYVNNNVQGVNNSLLFSSSLNQRNPGVHLRLSPLKPAEAVVNSVEGSRTVDARKVEVATTPTERLAYAPTVRRRCLRGLFLESSDSEPDNPEKPQRHGCRVGCDKKSRDGNVDVQ